MSTEIKRYDRRDESPERDERLMKTEWSEIRTWKTRDEHEEDKRERTVRADED